ncbi:MAG: glycine cleavage system protein GcvH [Synechococcales cyanobacterium RU_4_20]|nr:glycine cleavage system protein GcvH [Synechococcales cyanobacterium RU_4_20]NJR70695.1 glycine cleavage system protein GcvH [Synechococcales cyanobacterium CRU_2_2]
MATEYPTDLKYLDSHEYIRLEGDTATIGITAFAIDQLGDVVFLELPEVGSVLEKGTTFGSVESVKAVEDLYAPVSGEVLERNEAAIEAPETLVEDPYGKGWLLKVRTSEAIENTMDAATYSALVEGSH